MLRVILFDFGGVLAEEGFREGLQEIARQNGLDPDAFYSAADSLIQETGYLTGQARETDYWNAIRQRTGVRGTDGELREEILKRFAVRPAMLECVDLLRSKGFRVAMLSDQTNWLDEINDQVAIFGHFDRVMNSFETHLTKRNAATFTWICDTEGVQPDEILFVDDNSNHIRRAAARGLKTIRFTTFQNFSEKMASIAGTTCRK